MNDRSYAGNGLNWMASACVRLGATLLSGRGRRASLAILIFHRVLPVPDPLLPDEPDARRFAALLDLLRADFRVLPLREAVRRLASGSLPARAVAITFDDGYANNCEVAMPLLAARQLPATVFVASGFLNGGIMFNDLIIESMRAAPAELDLEPIGLGRFTLSDDEARRSAATDVIRALKYLAPDDRYAKTQEVSRLAGATPPRDLMMNDDQVGRLHSAGIEIGAHTVTHPILTRIDRATARKEMLECKRRLADLTSGDVTSFAYPNGAPSRDYNHDHVGLAKECGFELALTTAWGTASAGVDEYQLPRISPWDRGTLKYAGRIARAYAQRDFAIVSTSGTHAASPSAPAH